jgi:hypothetical protein
MKKSQSEGQLTLFRPYSWKPFLETKKKIRSKKVREAFELIEQAANIFQYELKNGEIVSIDAKSQIQEFLQILTGKK